MAFQNNSGDIILDVVLTDEGRKRLAEGNFSIDQFALADDEINYALFNTGSTTALQDLSILQTPILEAFTNNSSLMKSKLISLPNQSDLLYLPILKLNEGLGNSAMHERGNFVVCVDQTTTDDQDAGTTFAIGYNAAGPVPGMIFGLDSEGLGSYIAVDSGVDSTDLSTIGTLAENAFIIEMDNRLGNICDRSGTEILTPQAVDDDNVAMYIIDSAMTSFVKNVLQLSGLEGNDSPINGPVGARLEFKIRSSEQLRTSNFLFDRIGSEDATNYKDFGGSDTQPIRLIDSMVRVSGLNMGYSIDVPVRFAKSKTS